MHEVLPLSAAFGKKATVSSRNWMPMTAINTAIFLQDAKTVPEAETARQALKDWQRPKPGTAGLHVGRASTVGLMRVCWASDPHMERRRKH
jgi:hypothetical protein